MTIEATNDCFHSFVRSFVDSFVGTKDDDPIFEMPFRKIRCVAIRIVEETVCLPHPFSNLDCIIVKENQKTYRLFELDCVRLKYSIYCSKQSRIEIGLLSAISIHRSQSYQLKKDSRDCVMQCFHEFVPFRCGRYPRLKARDW